MSTGNMYGADSDALDHLAGEIGGAGRHLHSAHVKLGRQIHAAPWHGRNADRFRHQWDGEYRRSMASAASFLEEAESVLRRNADEQRKASDVHRGLHVIDWDRIIANLFGGHVDHHGDEGWDGILEDLWNYGGKGVGGINTFLEVVGKELVHVKGYVTKAGTIVDDYVRWGPGKAKIMKEIFGDAADIAKFGKYAKWADKGFTWADGVFKGVGQWQKDGAFGYAERAFRSGAVGLAHVGTGMAAGWAGAEAGMWIGGALGSVVPGAGTAIGAVVGAGIGIGIGIGVDYAFNKWDLDGKIADGASEAWKQGGKAVHEVAHVGSEVIHDGGKVLSSGANLAKKGWHSLWD